MEGWNKKAGFSFALLLCVDWVARPPYVPGVVGWAAKRKLKLFYTPTACSLRCWAD